jgi:hypothetical protein
MFYGFELLGLEYLRLFERERHQALHSKLAYLRIWVGDEAYELQALSAQLGLLFQHRTIPYLF